MGSDILLQGKSCNLTKFRLGCFLLPGILLAAGLGYSLYMFAGNVNFCRDYTEPGSCLLTYENSYPEFLKLSILYGKYTKLLPVLSWSGLLLLIRGIWLSMSRGRCELTVTDWGIRGKTRWGNPVSLPLSAVREVCSGPQQALILRTDAGEIPFYHMANREALCTRIQTLSEKNSGESRADETAEGISLSGETGSNRLLALQCFLPAAAFLLAAVCLGAEKFGQYRAFFFSGPVLVEKKILLLKLLGNLLNGNMGQLTRLCFYLFFPALLAGIYFWLADRSSSLKIAGGRITGCSRFGGKLELPLTKCIAVSRGRGGKLMLWHAGGRSVFAGIRNRKEICSALEELWGLPEETDKQTANK